MNVLLLSGGLDSSALAVGIRPALCLTIDYGQRAAAGEIAASEALCKELELQHRLIRVDLSHLGSGDMATRSASASTSSASEFWPFRNQMLITLAGMFLLPEGIDEIIIGSVAKDRHADGRGPFLRAIDRLMRLQEGNIRVSAPAARISTVDLLKNVNFPRELAGITFSCHVHKYACGSCNGCRKHRTVIEDVYGESGRLR
ncbi:7-cyano-7-deazaguanine synthase [Dongia sp.]|uniref:7-cyano-7-deazaguanine synthase n=1 Tax=Dongia sp. TaxID=1977262 RepID=UPI003752F4F6